MFAHSSFKMKKKSYPKSHATRWANRIAINIVVMQADLFATLISIIRGSRMTVFRSSRHRVHLRLEISIESAISRKRSDISILKQNHGISSRVSFRFRSVTVCNKVGRVSRKIRGRTSELLYVTSKGRYPLMRLESRSDRM